MERFMIIVNGWKPLTIITKGSILDVAAVLDPPLIVAESRYFCKKPILDVWQGSEYASGVWNKFTNWMQKNCVRNLKNTTIQGFLYRIRE